MTDPRYSTETIRVRLVSGNKASYRPGTVRIPEDAVINIKNRSGTGTLSVNDKQVGEGRIDTTVPVVFSTDDTFDVGADWGTAVSPTYQTPFEFTGTLKQVTIEAR